MAIIWFVTTFGVNAPFMDEWALTSLLANVETGQLGFADVTGLHNEHRPVVPRLILLTLALLTNWNAKVAMFVSVMTVVGGAGLLANLARRHFVPRASALFSASLLTTAILLFSFVQFENWLWGWQLSFFLTTFFTVVAIAWCASSSLTPHVRFWGAALACTFATYSAAHGIVSWISVLPVVVSSTALPWRRNVRLLVWCGLICLCAGVYAIGFRIACEFCPGPSYVLTSPGTAFRWLFGLLGNPLAGAPYSLGYTPDPQRNEYAVYLGVALTAAFAITSRGAWKSAGSRLALPWICLGVFSILSCAMTAIGRSGWGWGPWALGSRYTTAAIPLIISVVQLGYMTVAFPARAQKAPDDGHGPRLAARRSAAYVIALTAGIALTFATSVQVVTAARSIADSRQTASALRAFTNYLDPSADGATWGPLFALYPISGVKLVPALERGSRLGFQGLLTDVTFSEDARDQYGQLESVEVDARPGSPDGSVLRISGWTVKSPSLRELVFVGCWRARTFLTATWLGGTLSGIGGSAAEEGSRVKWQASIPAAAVSDECELSAWVYEPGSNQFIKLGNKHHSDSTSR